MNRFREIWPEKQQNPSAQPRQEDGKTTNNKICFFRCSLVVSLLLFGALAASSSYIFIHEYEDRLYHEEFDSISNDISVSVDKGLSIKMDLLTHISSLMGFLCPQNISWPNCSLPSATYHSLTSPLLSAGDARTIGVGPVLRLDQKRQFEEFAYDYFKADGGYPSGTGLSPFKGIYKKDSSDHRIPDLTGDNNFSSYSQLFVPVFLVSDLPNNYKGIMFNMHSEIVRSQAIDATLNCTKSPGVEVSSSRCTSITDVIQLVSDRRPSPASIIFSPIFPSQDNQTLVGLSVIIFNWANLLAFEIPFGCSIYCILMTNTVEHIFLLHGKTATYLGSEMTEKITSTFASDYRFKRTVIQRNELLTSTEYSLKFIPHQNFSREYHSFLPTLACVVCSLIVLIISAFFVLFDFFSKREAAKNAALLDSKRIFVRFISHEIRSPLNTIALGLEVLRDKVLAFKASPPIPPSLPVSGETTTSSGSSIAEPAPSHHTNEIAECLEIIRELNENSEAAVVVLNDLINYDKIELKTFTVDKKEVSLGRLIESTCHSLLSQAKQKNISLTLEIDHSPTPFESVPFGSDSPPASSRYQIAEGGFKLVSQNAPVGQSVRFIINGDSVKLSQVFRNVISNALKLTPSQGVVSVNGLLPSSFALSPLT
jgi:signal transduction histidine kinase